MGLVGKGGTLGIRRELIWHSVPHWLPHGTTLQGVLVWAGVEERWAEPHTVILEQAHAPNICIFCSSLEEGRRASYFPSFERTPCLLHPRVRWERSALETSLS